MTLSDGWRTHVGPRRIKALLGAGALGTIRGFQATASATPGVEADRASFWADPRNGVVASAASPLFDLLTWWLGPLTVTACADDARGGLEAEAEIMLAARDGAAGRLFVSRLRTLAGRIVVEGEAGRAELDLESFAVTASVPLPPPAAAAAAETPGASEAFVADCRRLRQGLHQPWETPPDPATEPLLQGRPVLVTGATGFIGARLVEKLAGEHGARVTALVRSPRRAARIARFDIDLQVADLAQDLGALVAGKAVVFNLAHDFKRSEAANLAGFRNLAATAAQAGVGRFVQASSIAVYDDWPGPDLTEASPAGAPGHAYKTAKAAMDAELRRRTAAGELAAVIVQPTIVYGPASAQWTDEPAERLATGTVVLPDDEAGRCNAVYVDDVVQGMILAATRPGVEGESFILSGPEAVPWRRLFAGYAAAIGRPEALRFEPMTPPPPDAPPAGGLKALLRDPMRIANAPPVRALLNLARRIAGEAAIEKLRAAVVNMRSRGGAAVFHPAPHELRLYLSPGVCRIDKAREGLGYAPAFDIDRGLAATGAYLRSRLNADGQRG
jgi:nucleoside-diphosphate-sugar epimerase